MQQEQIDYIAKKIIERIGEYVNSLDRRNLGIPMMDELAVNHVRLQSDYDYMKRDRDIYRHRYWESQRRIAALKGVITKLKKKP